MMRVACSPHWKGLANRISQPFRDLRGHLIPHSLPDDEEVLQVYQEERSRSRDSASVVALLAAAYSVSPEQIRSALFESSRSERLLDAGHPQIRSWRG